MGNNNSTRRASSFDSNGEVNFDHFEILRSIGRGSFGKVCIVRQRSTKQMYAMKYMNKLSCVEKNSVENVLSEVALLADLDHPFLVNLWFAFQDEEDMFLVVDLLLGGDLRYHMQKEVNFSENCVRLYVCEVALALDFLKTKGIVHRDVKPDNILLDQEGHTHLTDFNVAVRIEPGELLTSMSGTKQYMAPEIFASFCDGGATGYSSPIDWWSLGVCAYEMRKGKRPYDIKSGTTPDEVLDIYANTFVRYPSGWDPGFTNLLEMLMSRDPDCRISSIAQLRNHPYMTSIDFEQIMSKSVKPDFIPSKDGLNCDPSYELEEMIIESNPLYKKKKRLAKKNAKLEQSSATREHQRNSTTAEDDSIQIGLKTINERFKTYDRFRWAGLSHLCTIQTVRNRNKMNSVVVDRIKSNSAQGDQGLTSLHQADQGLTSLHQADQGLTARHQVEQVFPAQHQVEQTTQKQADQELPTQHPTDEGLTAQQHADREILVQSHQEDQRLEAQHQADQGLIAQYQAIRGLTSS